MLLSLNNPSDPTLACYTASCTVIGMAHDWVLKQCAIPPTGACRH
jgi:hypothetical protein